MTLVVTIKNGDFKWSRDGQLILKDINVSIPKGKLVAVVGRVGSGKSSILSAILSDMYRMRGSVRSWWFVGLHSTSGLDPEQEFEGKHSV